MGIMADPEDLKLRPSVGFPSALHRAPELRSSRVPGAADFLKLTRKYTEMLLKDEDGEAVMIFGLLDPKHVGAVTALDMQAFLHEHGVRWSMNEAEALVEHIDSGPGQGKSFLEQDFIDFIAAYKGTLRAVLADTDGEGLGRRELASR